GQADGGQRAGQTGGQAQPDGQADGGQPTGQATGQADSQAQGLTAASAPREFEAPDYTMDWEPQFGGIGAMADAASDPVVGIGSDGGVILNAATNDRRWNPEGTSVLGSARMQTATINGVTYALRVGVVSVKGNLRTRVIATVIDGALGGHGVGEVQALDFHFVAAGGESDMHWGEIPKRVRDNRAYIRQNNHDNFFDYDFAVAGDSEQGCLILSVISGKRDLSGASNAENLANVSTDLVFTTVVFRQSRAANDKGLFSTYLQPLSWGGNFLLDVAGAKKYHCLSNLQITMQFENRNNMRSSTAVIAFLDRSGDQPQDCINDKNALVRLGIMLYSYMPFNGDSIRSLYTDVDASAIEKLVNNSGCPLNDLSAYELVFWPRPSNSNSSTFVVRGANKANYYSMVFDTKYYEFGGGIGLYRPEIKAIKWHGAYDANTRLHMWREEDGNPVFLGTEAVSDQFAVTAQQDAALTAMAETADGSGAVVDAYKRRLCSARVGDSSLQFSKIGPDDFGISSFGVCGDFIYWPGTKDGVTGHTFDETSSELAENEPENKKYIMGARFRMGSFGNPFYLADLPHAADQMVSLDGTAEALTVVTCGVKNLETNTADLHVVRIPFVRAVNAIRAFVSTPYVVAGKLATFYIAIRNDGNTYIGGCEVEMYEGSDKSKKLDSTSIAFDATTTQASEFNGEKEDGTLEDVEPDFALAPGKTSVYAVGFTIPESWKGGEDANGNRITKSVSFRALHPTTKSATAGDAVVSQADDEEGVEYHVDGPTTVMDAIEIDVEVYAPDYMSHTDAPVTPYTPGVSDGDGKGTGAGAGAGAGANQGTGGGVGSTANAGASRATLPNTADHNSLGTAGALGAIGAAVLAYERRRARNER
ncbi:MAG: hypothetical protein IKG21_01820, partial [Atopobiaceae bacterium]|nr:hypothetical protein [Atopobiaceae bacterium]